MLTTKWETLTDAEKLEQAQDAALELLRLRKRENTVPNWGTATPRECRILIQSLLASRNALKLFSSFMPAERKALMVELESDLAA